MPFVICLTGPQVKEKDELLENLSAALQKKGKTVGIINNSKPLNQPITPKLTLSQDSLILEKPFSKALNLAQLVERFFSDLDIVLTGAFKEAKKVKIAFCPTEKDVPKSPDPGLRGYVECFPQDTELPVFTIQETDKLADHIINDLIPPKEPARVRILLNGRKVPIKDFVQDIIANTVRAMVGSLRKGDEPGPLELYIDE